MDIEKVCNEVLDELNPCYDIKQSLRNAFITVIKYLNQFPENLSVRSKNNIPDVKTKEGIEQLAVSYFNGFHSPTVPKLPQTVPDEMVSFISFPLASVNLPSLLSSKILYLLDSESSLVSSKLILSSYENQTILYYNYTSYIRCYYYPQNELNMY